MNKKLKRAVAAALSCAAALTVFASCGRDLGDLTEPAAANSKPQETVIITMDADDFMSLMGGMDGNFVLNTVTNAPAPTNPQSPPAPATIPQPTVPAVSAQPSGAEQPSTAASSTSPLNYSKEELLTYFNTCVNKIKQNKPGLTREQISKIDDIKLSNSVANSLIGVVKGALLSEDLETTTVEKGQSCNNVVCPEGKDYVSALTAADIANITVAPAGSGYTITVTIPEATNPDAGSVYERIFQYLTVDDVMSTYVPKVGATVAKQDVTLNYKGCTATLTVDEHGNATEYKTFVSRTMILKNASIKKGITINTDVEALLNTDATYKNFVW